MKIVNEFKAIHQNFNQRMGELEAEAAEVAAKIKELEAAFAEALQMEALTGKKSGDKVKIEAELKDAQNRAADIENMRVIVETAKRQKLSALLPGVESWRTKKRKSLEAEYSKKAEEVRAAKASYLKSLCNLHDVNVKLSNINAEVIAARQAVGDNRHLYDDGIKKSLFYKGWGQPDKVKAIGVSEEEVLNAHNKGIMSDWLNEYLEKGAE